MVRCRYQGSWKFPCFDTREVSSELIALIFIPLPADEEKRATLMPDQATILGNSMKSSAAQFFPLTRRNWSSLAHI